MLVRLDRDQPGSIFVLSSESRRLHGPQPRRAPVPPKGSSSMTATDQPALRQRPATFVAAVQVPMTTGGIPVSWPVGVRSCATGCGRLPLAGFLYRRARHRAVGTGHAAIARMRTQHRSTALAVVEELTRPRVRRPSRRPRSAVAVGCHSGGPAEAVHLHGLPCVLVQEISIESVVATASRSFFDSETVRGAGNRPDNGSHLE